MARLFYYLEGRRCPLSLLTPDPEDEGREEEQSIQDNVLNATNITYGTVNSRNIRYGTITSGTTQYYFSEPFFATGTITTTASVNASPEYCEFCGSEGVVHAVTNCPRVCRVKFYSHGEIEEIEFRW